MVRNALIVYRVIPCNGCKANATENKYADLQRIMPYLMIHASTLPSIWIWPLPVTVSSYFNIRIIISQFKEYALRSEMWLEIIFLLTRIDWMHRKIYIFSLKLKYFFHLDVDKGKYSCGHSVNTHTTTYIIQLTSVH